MMTPSDTINDNNVKVLIMTHLSLYFYSIRVEKVHKFEQLIKYLCS